MTSESESAATPTRPAGAGTTGLLMIGAAIIVGGWLLFSVIMAEFTYNLLTVAVSALALMAILNVGGLALGNRTLKLLGYFMGVVGVLFLVYDLRLGFPDGVVDNLANIAFYVGCALMLVGARGLPE